ncbi:M23 family metallopeptidase [Longispora sp. NPDC051575]|uniref:M23 family metallopeptidase n=1 Tax=Longispora sp. NPDC051575 TaxID=3154943 RepID=UPI00342B767E
MRHTKDAEEQFEPDEHALQQDAARSSKVIRHRASLTGALRNRYVGASLAIVAVTLAAVASLVSVNSDKPATASATVTESDRNLSARADRAQRQDPAPAPSTAAATTPSPEATPSPAAPPPPPPPPPKPAWVSPVADYTFTSEFGERWGALHAGVDLANGEGTQIRAAAAGTVELAATYDYGGYGFAVIINHGDGVRTLYGHNSAVQVHAGQRVEAGQNIALMGNTGNSMGSHCHFEVHVGGDSANNGNAVDPQAFMAARGVKLN